MPAIPLRLAPTSPPPLPGHESATVTYLKALGTTAPAVVIWLFMRAFALPKLHWLWQKTELTGSKAQWLMDASNILAQGVQVFIAVGVLVMAWCEVRAGSWPRYRSTVVAVVVVTFHTAVLLSLTAITISALLAVPLMMRVK